MTKQQLSKFLVTTVLLSSTIVLINTSTNPPTVSADDTITPIDDTITITVDSACTMGQTVLQSSNTLNPGETSTIGGSRIAAYCNDSEGYAIYAIGYTNGEYGNTNLVSTQNPSHIIPTGTSGTDSYWNMKLTGGTATGPVSYQPTMVNTFTTNTNIPNDYAKVAYRDSSTISQTEDPTETGSYFTTTYETHLSTTQSAGIYNGQVQYVMVHPAGAPAPEVPTMQDVATIKAKLTNVGDTMQAVDNRDGKKYWITKLADGNIWMTQNLDFDIEAGRTYTPANTDIPASWTPNVSTYSGDTTTISSLTSPSSYDPGNLYWNGTVATHGGTITENTTTSGNSHYHIGNYYNWTAAVAMNDSSSYNTGPQDVNQSICPAGWRLPTYEGNKSFTNLKNSQNLTSGTSGNIHIFPTYYVYGGSWGDSTSYEVGSYGNYWSSVVHYSYGAYQLKFSVTGELYTTLSNGRNLKLPIRCVIR